MDYECFADHLTVQSFQFKILNIHITEKKIQATPRACSFHQRSLAPILQSLMRVGVATKGPAVHEVDEVLQAAKWNDVEDKRRPR
ncbi:hypothetical protein NUU61_003098 [Penicillium alfredii]|uniref:Uncharacterized protein n=1 Tax=Penicillium alfredii TaxID=1506179 RepID=A0A9W9KH62_9EURO|nr:uncharacterized protein NUU61_003098 [Penicillium alfredii]KAJ5105751.1 hypothetical protein NUU61_003098 [Penicillium alfredii]